MSVSVWSELKSTMLTFSYIVLFFEKITQKWKVKFLTYNLTHSIREMLVKEIVQWLGWKGRTKQCKLVKAGALLVFFLRPVNVIFLDKSRIEIFFGFLVFIRASHPSYKEVIFYLVCICTWQVFPHIQEGRQMKHCHQEDVDLYFVYCLFCVVGERAYGCRFIKCASSSDRTSEGIWSGVPFGYWVMSV